jgi:hypothetical protein
MALVDARAIGAASPADAISLGAYDAEAGGGRFYAKCGFQEQGRVVSRVIPLAYYEFLLQ